jgi:hypothetical protein
MKKVSYALIVLVALLALPAATLYAQSTGTWFKVPFPFTVTDKAMPAGQYLVESLYWDAVAIHHSKGEVGLIVLAQKSNPPQDLTPKLVFRRYANVYFLAEVHLRNMDSGRTLAPGKTEMQLAQVEKRQPTVEVTGR